MSSKEDMKQCAFTYPFSVLSSLVHCRLVFQDMFAPQDFEQGPPFPKTVQYGTIPPVVKTFVKNRRTPMYFLGWRFSERDFLQKYGKPNAPLENILNVYDALLFPEWGRKFTDAWKLVFDLLLRGHATDVDTEKRHLVSIHTAILLVCRKKIVNGASSFLSRRMSTPLKLSSPRTRITSSLHEKLWTCLTTPRGISTETTAGRESLSIEHALSYRYASISFTFYLSAQIAGKACTFRASLSVPALNLRFFLCASTITMHTFSSSKALSAVCFQMRSMS
jgi:hypothetical protein